MAKVSSINTALLTRGELRVFELMMQGLSNKEVANKLCLSVSTVKVHLASCRAKLDIRSKSELLSCEVTVVRRVPHYRPVRQRYQKEANSESSSPE